MADEDEAVEVEVAHMSHVLVGADDVLVLLDTEGHLSDPAHARAMLDSLPVVLRGRVLVCSAGITVAVAQGMLASTVEDVVRRVLAEQADG